MEGSQQGSVLGAHASMSTSHVPRIWERRETFSLGPTHSLLPMETEEDADDYNDDLEALLKVTWTIWAVSPLFDFQYDSEVMLKLYGKRLREEIATSFSEENVAYKAKFTLVESIASNSRDLPMIHVEVHTIKENKDNERPVERCIYMGNFISWRTSSDRLNDGKCVRLPLLLCRGTKTAMKAVHMILGRMFDCMIMTFPISQDDLMWLIPIALNVDGKHKKRNAKKHLILEYVLPHLQQRNNIVVKFPINDMWTLWTAVYETENENEDDETQSGSDIIMKLEHIEKFYDILIAQMLTVAGLQLGFCLLNRISLPSITIKNNRMKVMNVETMDRVLLFLQEKAFDLLHMNYLGSSNNSSHT